MLLCYCVYMKRTVCELFYIIITREWRRMVVVTLSIYRCYARYQLNQSKNAIVPHTLSTYTLSHYNKLLLAVAIYTYQKGMKFMLFYFTFVLFFSCRFVKGNFIHIAWFVLPIKRNHIAIRFFLLIKADEFA